MVDIKEISIIETTVVFEIMTEVTEVIEEIVEIKVFGMKEVIEIIEMRKEVETIETKIVIAIETAEIEVIEMIEEEVEMTEVKEGSITMSQERKEVITTKGSELQVADPAVAVESLRKRTLIVGSLGTTAIIRREKVVIDTVIETAITNKIPDIHPEEILMIERMKVVATGNVLSVET